MKKAENMVHQPGSSASWHCGLRVGRFLEFPFITEETTNKEKKIKTSSQQVTKKKKKSHGGRHTNHHSNKQQTKLRN